MSKAKILKLKTEVSKMESVYSKSSTSDKTKAILRKAIDKAKGEIEKLEGKAAKKEPAKKEPKAAAEPKKRKARKKATPLERLKSLVKRKKYSAYSKTGVDLEKDAGQPALPTGKRKSKSGKTYYEYRANRIDVKQPPKRYPKLEDGGELSKEDFLKKSIVYDNGGESLDRYTVYTPDGSVYGMSETGSGFNQYLGEADEIPQGKHLGKKLKSVPKEIESAILSRMEYSKGGMMAKGGRLEVGAKYYDKKEKLFLTVEGESENPNVYNVKWEDGKKTLYSKKNIEFFIDKGIWEKKLADGGMMAKGGNVRSLLKSFNEEKPTIALIMIADDVSSEFMRNKFDKTIKWDELSDDEKQKYNQDYKVNKDKFETYLMYEFVKLYYSDDKVKEKCKGHSRRTLDAIKSVMTNLAKKYPEDNYADGGKIKDQYDGREPEDIWNNFSRMQRQHFLFDHADEIEIRRGNGELSGKEISDITKMEYSKLDSDIKKSFANHVREGQYKGGGSLDIDSYADGGELKKDYLVTFESQTDEYQPTTFQATSVYDLVETLKQTVPAEVEILSIEEMTPQGFMKYGGVSGY